MREIILDVDMGVDDAIAVMYLSTFDDVAIAAAGSVHGNIDSPTAALNVLRVFELCGIEAPVAVGASRPLVRPVHLAPEVHGSDGLGNATPPPPSRGPLGDSAPEQLVRLARADPGRYDVLATGPLTNLAIALILEPRLPELVASVTVMGGAADGVGNMSAVAEANIWHDPEAARLVFAAPWPLTMVGLDVTTRTILDEAALDRIASSASPRARFATAILPHYLGFYASINGGRHVCPTHDPLAAGVFADPSLITRSIRGEIQVSADDLTRGMTIVDRRADGEPVERPGAHAHTVVTEVDSRRFLEGLVERITA